MGSKLIEKKIDEWIKSNSKVLFKNTELPKRNSSRSVKIIASRK